MDSDDGPTRSDEFDGNSNDPDSAQGARSLSGDEAEEDHNVFVEENENIEEEEEGEDLMGEDMFEDYRPMPHLDTYDGAQLDEDVNDERSAGQVIADRRAAEEFLRRRDEVEKRTGRNRLPAIMRVRDDDSEEARARPWRRQRVDFETSSLSSGQIKEDILESDREDEAEIKDESLYKVQGNVREWVTREEVQRFVAKKFRHFLRTFKNQGSIEEEYIGRIKQMMENGACSLELDYNHLLHSHTIMAVWLADVPAPMIDLMSRVAYRLVIQMFPMFEEIEDRIHVRVSNLPIIDQIRNIRQTHLNTLIRVGGVVTRRTGVFPQLQEVKFDCGKCGAVIGPFFQNTSAEVKVRSCPDCGSKGPFIINIEQTIYRNYQKLTLQESPGTVPAGRLPRYKEVILLHDLIDCARPGEEIEVTGIYTNNFDAALNTKNGFPVFSTTIEANHVSKKQDIFAAYKLTEEDKAEIQKLASDPAIASRIIKSIAPSIYGHDNIKTAIALAMFGGREKNVQGKHRLRGDINVLLMGDPGTAKSQFLKYIEKTASRAVYTTGKGASAVGLTAAVRKDPVTREWTLEGGALVLADRGMCLIDEFDKMNDQDRVSIHEAMEQQSISISKAGIVTSLQARCSVVAAANPIGGRYDSSKTFGQNVELTEPILSRFDVLLVVKDTVDPVVDEMLAKFVVRSHKQSHPLLKNNISQETQLTDPELLTQSQLKKYITYAKAIQPTLHDADLDKIARVFADLRRESSQGQGVPLAVRHIESMIRMAEAHARLHLRTRVTDDDVDTAIRVLLDSFISTQKFGVQRSLQKTFKKYMTYKRDFNELLLYLLRGLVKDAIRYQEYLSRSRETADYVDVKLEDLEARAREYNIYDLTTFLQSVNFLENNFTFLAAQRVIRHPLVL